MRVADRHGPEAVVEVDVLVPVDIPHLRPAPLAEVDRVRLRLLEARRHAERERADRALVQRRARRRAVEQRLALRLDELACTRADPLVIARRHHFTITCFTSVYASIE